MIGRVLAFSAGASRFGAKELRMRLLDKNHAREAPSRRSFLVFSACVTAGVLAAANANSETVAYTYDELGRVRTVTYGNGQVVTYVYDAAGNRTTLNQSTPTALNGSLSASPALIAPGGSSTLNWTSQNATSASISNGVGAVTPIAGGSIAVSPAATSTYTLTLTGPGGTIQRQVTVSVA